MTEKSDITENVDVNQEDKNSQLEQTDENIESAEVNPLEQIKQLEQQLAKANDDVLRAAAEVQNLRRRTEQDIEKAHKFALERFAGDLLAVVDSLERGLEITKDTDDATKAVREGMQLTLKLLLDILQSYQVVPVNPVNEAFDPAFHQAMSMREDIEVEPNTVLEVFQKGYKLHDRLLRPAMVVVSKAPTAEEAESA